LTDSTAEVTEAALRAYTWTNYIHPITGGDPPPMFVMGKKGRRKFKEEFVKITDRIENPEFTFNGVQIFNKQECILLISAITPEIRELIFDDIKIAFERSSRDITYRNVKTRPNLKRFEREFNVKITG